MRKRQKVVVITGASSGIGRATARLFAAKGWRVGLVARDQDGLEAARREVARAGSTGCVAVADVSDLHRLDAAAARIERELGPIDVWVNDAGVSAYGSFLDITPDEFHRVTEVTYGGVVNGTRVALRRMKPRDRGVVVNVGSMIAHRAVPLQSPYSGAKYAVRGFTEAVRSELLGERSRVRISIVHPPSVNTLFVSHAASHLAAPPRVPRPVFQPEVIADAIHLAATTARREIKVTGPTVQMAIANTVFPGALDWVLGRFGAAAQTSGRKDVAAARDPALLAPPRRVPTAHGPLDDEAHARSGQMWAARHRGALGAGIGVAALAALVPLMLPAVLKELRR